MCKSDRIKVIIGFALIGLIIVAIFALPYLRFGRLRLFEFFEGASTGSYQLVQEQEFPADGVRDIEVIWGSGDAAIVPGSGNVFVVREEARPNLGGKMPQQAWIRAENGCLKARWNENGSTSTESTPASGPNDGGENRRITIEVPAAAQDKLGSIVLNGTSGSYQLGRLTSDAVEVDFTSGELKCVGVATSRISLSFTSGSVATQELSAETLDVSLTSGDAALAGIVRDAARIDLTSGDVETSFTSLPATLDVTFTTGNVVLNLPAQAGFTAQVSTTSGDVTSDFAQGDAGTAGTDSATRVYRNGDGSAAIIVALTSGDLALQRA